MLEFRIILHMHHFFEDYRSSCRLFITSKIKIIKDLKKHISTLFELKDEFYLISNNLYLPNLEDVRVLREDDLVIVIPCHRSFTSNVICNSEPEIMLESQDTSTQISRTVLNQEWESFDFEEPGTVKKKKKRKNCESETLNCTNIDANGCESFAKKKKKKKRDSHNETSEDANETQFNEFKREVVVNPFNCQEACDVIKNDKIIKKETNLNGNFELPSVRAGIPRFPFIVPRKNIKLMEISTKPKVVKSVIVNDARAGNIGSVIPVYDEIGASFTAGHNKNSEVPCLLKYPSNESKIVELPQSELCKNNVDYKTEQIENKITPENQEIDSAEVKTNENVQILSVKTFNKQENQSNEEQLLRNESIGPQLIPISQNAENSELTKEDEIIEHVSPCQVPLIPTPAESIVSTVTEESLLGLETKPKRKRIRKRKKNKKQENGFEPPVVYSKPVFTSAAPVIHIRFKNEKDQNGSEDNLTKNMIPEDTASLVDFNSTLTDIDINLNYDKLCKEILKYPVMKEKLPKQSDVIAFKICRLSESYTPEISNVIVAKVLNYCPTTCNVFVNILEGADECSTPEGKFYMEGDENYEDEKEFSWKDLIEPRLLFP